uniref:Uncharacterized protein n=1 Tax=Tanacetum cinerariifolium TaxID=118510 RepID=A0A6L2KIA5_TANCI|nr:hypothetical protein [Tanacetum cinerariifolium]
MAITFADTHNMIAYLTKSDASKGFDQIIDFLNASSIKYALTEKVIITEATIREALRLDDAESIDCLPNEEIFTELSRMGTSWNEFSSSMASAVICLSTGNGFSGVETPLFEGMILAQQANDVADEVAASVDVDDVPAAAAEPSLPSPTPTTQPPPSQELPSTSHVIPTSPPSLIDDKVIEKDADVQGRPEESQAQIYKIDLEHDDKVLSMKDDELEPAELKEVVEVVTTAKFTTEVVTAAAATITAATTLITAAIISTAPSAARRRKGVVIRDLEETTTPSIIIHSKPKSKDKGKEILVEEPKPLKKQAQIEQDEAYARELEAELNKNINWDDVIKHVQRKEKKENAVLRNMAGFKMDYFKGMSYDGIRPIFEKYFNSNLAFIEKTKEQLEEEDSRALKRTSESQEEKAAKNKSQKLGTIRVMWSSHHNPYNHSDDLASREKMSIDEVHFGSDAEQFLQDTLQLSLAEQKSHEELEATQNVKKVKEHFLDEEIKKLVEGTENVKENFEVASSPLRNDDNQTNLGTRLEPRSAKERPEVEKINDISQYVNVIEEEEESTEDDYELKRREKSETKIVDVEWNHVGELWSRYKVIMILVSSLRQVKDCPEVIKSHIFVRLLMAATPCKPYVVFPRDQYNPHDDAHLEGENSVKRQKKPEHETLVFEESLPGQHYESKPCPSTLGVESYQEQVNVTAPTITFPGIEKYKMFSIVSEPLYDIIYKIIKKEKRVMRHQEVYNFCDATLKRVLERLKSYNNDVKYGYVTHNLSKEDVEYL